MKALRMVLAALVVATGLSFAAPATPAAAATCVAGKVTGNEFWDPLERFSVVLYRTASCGYYSKLTIADPVWGANFTFNWKVERQIATPYGFTLSAGDTRSASKGGANQGAWNTGTAPGFGYSTAALEQDRHRTCYQIPAGSAWTCGSWAAV